MSRAGSKTKALQAKEQELGALFELAKQAMAARAPEPPALPPDADDADLLVYAIETGSDTEVAALLARNVNPNGLTRAKVAPILVACGQGRLPVLVQLVQAGVVVTTQAVESSVLHGHRAAFEYLIAQRVVSQGTKSADRDALSIARERALKFGWRDFDGLVRSHRETLGLVKTKS